MNLSLRKKQIIGVVVAVLLILLGGLWVYHYYNLGPAPDNITFTSRNFSFVHPRINHVEEYASGAVSVERDFGDTYFPLVEIVRYRNDPDVALPVNYDAFIKKQAVSLCGADGPVESVSCSDPEAVAYTSPKGYAGQKLSLTLTRKNLKTGTTTPSVFSPVYVFNITRAASSTDPEDALRYQALFIYPSLASVLSASTSPELMNQVLDSFVIPNGVTTVGQ